MATKKQPAAAPSPAPAPSGPPRWTYAIPPLVAVGGLIWGIVSYFIPKPEPTKPPAPPVAATTAPAPSVSGSGNNTITVGRDMNNSQIVVNGPVPPAPAAASKP